MEMVVTADKSIGTRKAAEESHFYSGAFTIHRLHWLFYRQVHSLVQHITRSPISGLDLNLNQSGASRRDNRAKSFHTFTQTVNIDRHIHAHLSMRCSVATVETAQRMANEWQRDTKATKYTIFRCEVKLVKPVSVSRLHLA